MSSNIWTANLQTTPAQMNLRVNILDVPREHQLTKLWYMKCQFSRELTLMLYNLSKLTREMAQLLTVRYQPMNPVIQQKKVSGLQTTFHALHHMSPT